MEGQGLRGLAVESAGRNVSLMGCVCTLVLFHNVLCGGMVARDWLWQLWRDFGRAKNGQRLSRESRNTYQWAVVIL